MVRPIRAWIRTVLGRRRLEAEMTEEMRSHIALRAEDLERSGLAQGEALRRARAEFGSVEGAKEGARQALGLRLWDELRGDLRYAFITLRGAPGYTAVAVITLALGIGATTTIFSVINGVLLRPLPFPESRRLVQIGVTYPNGAFALYLEAASYQSVGAYSFAGELNLLSDGVPERIQGRSVSVGFFATLGLSAQLGRIFVEGEDRPGGPPVAVISDALWRRRFGADPTVVGRVVAVDGRPREIVGVLPRGFNYPVAGTEMWIPMLFDPRTPIPLWNSQSTFVGRLRSGVSIAAADAEHRALIPQVRDGFPWTMPTTFGTVPENRVRALREVMTAGVRDRLVLLFGAVALVLLVACVNVANLNLTRVASRADELRVRQALGGTRARVARQLLVEQLVLAGVGAAAGVAIALAGTPLLVRWLPADTARLDQVTVDGMVLGFTALAAVLAGILTALIPVVRLSRRGPALIGLGSRSASGDSERSRVASALVVAEVALAVALVIGAGLVLRSLGALLAVDPGIRVERLISARVTLDRARCTSREVAPGSWELPPACRPFFEAFQERLAGTPGISRHALSVRLPLEERGGGMAMDVEDNPFPPNQPAHWLEQRTVTPEYFALLGVTIEEGRALTRDDRAGAAPAVVISRAVANRYWPGQSPIGKQIKPVWLPTWWRVVGVAKDLPPADGAITPALEFYSALTQAPAEEFFVLAETGLEPSSFESTLRQVLQATDPTVPLSRVRTLAEVRGTTTALPRVTSTLLSGFALLALMLGAIGVYGVLSYGVLQRRKEIGIRMAVGAGAGEVRGMVLGRAGRLLAGGVVLGVVGAWFGTRLLEQFLYGIAPRDPLTFGAAVLLFVAVGLIAAYLPARRATRIAPTAVLRDG